MSGYIKKEPRKGLILSYLTIYESVIFQEMDWLANGFLFSNLFGYSDGPVTYLRLWFMFTGQIL